MEGMPHEVNRQHGESFLHKNYEGLTFGDALVMNLTWLKIEEWRESLNPGRVKEE